MGQIKGSRLVPCLGFRWMVLGLQLASARRHTRSLAEGISPSHGSLDIVPCEVFVPRRWRSRERPSARLLRATHPPRPEPTGEPVSPEPHGTARPLSAEPTVLSWCPGTTLSIPEPPTLLAPATTGPILQRTGRPCYNYAKKESSKFPLTRDRCSETSSPPSGPRAASASHPQAPDPAPAPEEAGGGSPLQPQPLASVRHPCPGARFGVSQVTTMFSAAVPGMTVKALWVPFHRRLPYAFSRPQSRRRVT